jgi:MFS family permease
MSLNNSNCIGWSSPVGPRIHEYFPIPSSTWSWIASIYNIGCSVSCLIIGYCMDMFGRKWTMLLLVIPFTIGWSLLTFAQNVIMLLIGRFLLGFAAGAFYLTVPQYTTEIAEKEIRGTLGSFLQLLISLGVLFVYTIGAFLSVFYTNIVCGICPLIFFGIFIFMPETPMYFLIKNNESKAVKSLQWLRGDSYNIELEIKELKDNLQKNGQVEKIPFKNAIQEKSSIAALVIGMGLLFVRHMSCIIPILFYATMIFAVSEIYTVPHYISRFHNDPLDFRSWSIS